MCRASSRWLHRATVAIYRGRVWPARAAGRRRDDSGHRVLDRLDDQGDHLRPRRCSWSSAASLRSTGRLPKCSRNCAGRRRCSTASTPPASRGCARHSGRSRCATCSPIPPGFGYDIWNPEMGQPHGKATAVPGIISCQNAALDHAARRSIPASAGIYGINIDWAGKAVERGQRRRSSATTSPTTCSGRSAWTDTGFKLTDGSPSRLAGMHASRRRRRADARSPVRAAAGAGIRDGRRRALRHRRRTTWRSSGCS